MKNTRYYEVDAQGGVVMVHAYKPVGGTATVVDIPPPQSMLKPRWVSSADSGQWVDSATRAEHETHIDQQTDNAIQNWTREKGKNEAYYINCGIRVCIQNITDTTNVDYRHYHEYRAFVDAQKKLGKAKKDALP